MKFENKDYRMKRIYHNGKLGFKLTKYMGDQESFAVPDSVIGIGGGAFANNTALKTVYFPKTLAMLGESAFANCSRLESVILPDPIMEIKRNTFENCASLEHVRLPERLQVINHGAFLNCVHLKSIVIPQSVKLIYGMERQEQLKLCSSVRSSGHGGCASSGCGSSSERRMYRSRQIDQPSAFENCEQLTRLYFLGDLPRIEGDLRFHDSATIYCPQKVYKSYVSKFRQFDCQILDDDRR